MVIIVNIEDETKDVQITELAEGGRRNSEVEGAREHETFVFEIAAQLGIEKNENNHIQAIVKVCDKIHPIPFLVRLLHSLACN